MSVDTTSGTAVVLGPMSDVQLGEGRAYAVGDRQIAVFRLSDGTLRTTDAACPHKGGPLADGQSDLGVVVCPLHQYAFRFSDGGCTTAGIGAVHTYRISDEAGNIVVVIDPD
ncbi:Rieske 2Fe-2S domain-containing protein [Gordonia pseudamarae]|uniref:Rieske (2Fe-2S) protein n=1 Tax=Gordonia pseudamarae TaxID=2831662 RepID=UPI001AF88212|nr:Rieske (2Fe-2S) protein [Gordonia pseudamarae]QHN27548.1 Rieske 2Fe-2S domain-containing protein [Gordonia pseudamarae]